MKTYGEVPGGKQELQPLLYPFFQKYPKKLFSKYRWWKNQKVSKKLPYINKKSGWLTVINRLGARGDTLITANVIKCIKDVYENLKINCITPFEELILYDPFIETLNRPESFYSFDSSYFELIVRNEQNENIVCHNLKRLGIDKYKYKSTFHLLAKEINWAKEQLSEFKKPLIAISTRSKESVKNWPLANWIETINSISDKSTIIQLGDSSELEFAGVVRYAGKLSMRESAAILSRCRLFVGPDSLLMHIANGLDLKSIIIFGNARPVNCLGYPENINLTGSKQSKGTWMHEGYGPLTEEIQTMSNIHPELVSQKIHQLLLN